MRAATIHKFICLLLIFMPTSSHAAKRPTPPHELSVVTLNLYHDKAQWPKRLPMIVAELKKLQPDAIALQEVLQHETLPNQAQTIASALGYRYVFVSTDPADQVRRYGNAILTRHPILAQDWKKLEPLDDSRTAMHLRISVDGRMVNLYDTHLHWTDGGGAIRRQQVAGLLDFIAATRDGAPSIVMGDFNAETAAPELQALSKDFVEAYALLHPQAQTDPKARSTLNLAYFAPKHIDQIFLQRRDAFEPTDARIILDRADAEGVWASDHYGVYVRLRWLPSRPVNAGGP